MKKYFALYPKFNSIRLYLSEVFKIRSHNLLVIITLLVFASGYSLTPQYFALGQTNQIQNKIQTANNAVDQAFSTASEAEQVGANVTYLLGRLNDAADFLAQAENSYRINDTNSAAIKADNAISLAQEVTLSAQNAKQIALNSRQQTSWFSILLVSISLVIFLFALLLAWRFFKRSYVNNYYNSKPQVTNQ